jgi:hypothetical protein
MVNVKVRVKKLGEETSEKAKNFGTKIKTLPRTMVSSRRNLSILGVVIAIFASLALAFSYDPSRTAIEEKVGGFKEAMPFIGQKYPDKMVVLIETEGKDYIPMLMYLTNEGKVIGISPIEHNVEVEISSDLFEKLEQNPNIEANWLKDKEYAFPFETPFQKLLRQHEEQLQEVES